MVAPLVRHSGRALLLASGALAAIAAVPGRAAARPAVFAEGIVGVSMAIGTGGYTEDHEEVSLHTGVRGGIWFEPGRFDSRSGRRGRRVGLELQVDRASYGASYFYYQEVTNPDGTTSTVRVDPAYRRVRFLAGPRIAMPMHPIVDLILRAAGGIDRVSGTADEIAPVLEVGVQLSIHLGPIRLGLEGSIPVAFHDAELTESPGIGPQYGHRPGYGRAVDGIGCITLGAVF